MHLTKLLIDEQKRYEEYEEHQKMENNRSINDLTVRSDEIHKEMWNECLHNFKTIVLAEIEKFQY